MTVNNETLQQETNCHTIQPLTFKQCKLFIYSERIFYISLNIETVHLSNMFLIGNMFGCSTTSCGY